MFLSCYGICSATDEITGQIGVLRGGKNVPIHIFLLRDMQISLDTASPAHMGKKAPKPEEFYFMTVEAGLQTHIHNISSTSH